MDRLDCAPGRFGAAQFAGADLGDERRTKRLIRLADQLMAHPEGTLPDKIADPYQLGAAYRLFAEPTSRPRPSSPPTRPASARR